MGLVLTVLPKPKPDHEAEFHALWRRINEAEGKLPVLTAKPRKGLLGRLLTKSGPSFDAQAGRARLNEISQPAFTQLGAPVVGRDAAADRWLLERLTSGGMDDGSARTQLETMHGVHVLALVPPCDGLPVYAARDHAHGRDETTFDGGALKTAEAVLSDLVMEAYLPMLPEDAQRTGRDMMQRAAEFAADYDVAHALGQRDPPVGDDGDPATWAHIADQAGRWYLFWGGRGHGIDPDY